MKLRDIVNPSVLIHDLETKIGISTERANELTEMAGNAAEAFIEESKRQEVARKGERLSADYKRRFIGSPVNYIAALLADAEFETPQELAFLIFNGIQVYTSSVVIPKLEGNFTLDNIIDSMEKIQMQPMGKGGEA